MTRPTPISRWRFSLRTVVILLLVTPPVIAAAWTIWPSVQTALKRQPILYDGEEPMEADVELESLP